MLSMPLTAFATVVDYDDEPEIQEECEERSDYDNLCSGINGATGLPFCDQYNSTERARIFPNLTNPSHCLSREYNPIEFCQEFDDLTSTYEYCRNVPGSEEYFEYAKTGGPDESCLFDVYQIKCLPFPNADDCPEDFWTNEDGYCFPVKGDNWVCPDDYHDVDDDESGQCYPNSEDCPNDYILVPDPDEEDKGDRCANPSYICDEDPDHSECKECWIFNTSRYSCIWQ
jgi:hypothetical protein